MKKIKLMWQDWLILIGIALKHATAFMTKYILTGLDVVASTAIYAEMNPLVRHIITTQYISTVFIWMSSAITLGVYTKLRSDRLKNEIKKLQFNMGTFIVFYVFFSDFMWDLPIFLRAITGV